MPENSSTFRLMKLATKPMPAARPFAIGNARPRSVATNNVIELRTSPNRPSAAKITNSLRASRNARCLKTQWTESA